jgi:hypothetical protein
MKTHKKVLMHLPFIPVFPLRHCLKPKLARHLGIE